MKIKTRKFKNRILSRFIREATEFYLQRLLPRSKYSKIVIDVIGRDIIDSEGSCEPVDVNRYVIELKKGMSLELSLITLAHEIVHVKQYAQKELKVIHIRNDLVDVWKGKRYRNVDYIDQPWEQEAFSMDEDLYHDFLSECYATGRLQFE